MKRFLVVGVMLVGVLVLSLTGCGKKSDGAAALGTGRGAVAGVKWSIPKRWGAMPERPMRVATYGIPGADGVEAGECAVSFFGAGQGGDVASNIERWVGQFENAATPVKGSKDVGGLKISTVQIAGAYLAPSGPMMMSAGKKEDYRLLGAIVEAPEGMVFFKLIGPSKTVASAEGEFDAMVGSLTK